MSAARDIKGPWLNADVLNRVPVVRREFDLNRDPAIKAQIQDNNKTEAQRRREQPATQNKTSNDKSNEAARGSAMVKQDHPHPAPHPTGPDAQAVDRQAFKERWLAEQRDAVLAQAAERQRTQEPAPDLAHDLARASQMPSR